METTRSETLKACIVFALLIAVLLLYIGIWSLSTGIRANEVLVSGLPGSLWLTCGLFLVGCLVSYRVNTRSTTLASGLFCAFITCGVLTAALGFSTPLGVLGFLLPIFFANLLFDWKRVMGCTGLILVVSFYSSLVINQPEASWPTRLLPNLILLGVSAFMTYMFHVLFSDLEWYEKNYVSAQQKERIIRDNEVKLERLVKDLKEYQTYLNVTNELLKAARDEAEKAKNAKQIFVQNVSHELRTPLNLIIGFSETMFHTPGAYTAVNWTPELKTDVECIFRNSQHLKSLIDDVLDLASLENRSYEIHPVDMDLHTVLMEAVLITRDRYAAKGLSLSTDFTDRPLTVHADPVRIRQVILNLLSNALKYTSRGGVTIATRCTQTHALVEVEDTGKGIPENALDKVFEAFYQVDKSRNREDSGTGLGLTISKQLIELHEGEIWITSTLGKGTAVSFSLPLLA